MSCTNTFSSNVESVTEGMLKTCYFYYSFAKKDFSSKSSKDFKELKSFLQSTLETYEFLQRNSDKKIIYFFI